MGPVYEKVLLFDCFSACTFYNLLKDNYFIDLVGN